MKRALLIAVSCLITLLAFFVIARAQTEKQPDSGDIIQFNNLVVRSNSGSVPGEITAISAKSAVKCLKFGTLGSSASQAIDCPNPEKTAEISYRIQIETDTILLLKNRQKAGIGDVAVNDVINVFGFYNDDGTIRGLVVRDLSKPLERVFIQLENLEVIGILSKNPLILAAIHRLPLPCYSFQTGKKSPFPCPLGLKSMTDSPLTRDLVVPESVRPEIAAVRKYQIRFIPGTNVYDRNKKPIDPLTITVGDKLNVYGSYLGSDATEIEAEVVRDLSKPIEIIDTGAYEGIIVQFNTGDGTFIMRRRDGTLLEVKNPLQIDAFINVKGKFDDILKRVADITQIIIKQITDKNAPPLISKVDPGAGPPGTQVTLIGSGFTPTGNNVNFAGARSAATNLLSFDGTTLTFALPATPCSPGTVCAQVVIPFGSYPLSVINANGTSNEVTFLVTQLPTLKIRTTSLPQVVQGTSYHATVEAEGGTDSYEWGIVSGSLPQGLKITSAACAVRLGCPANVDCLVGLCRGPATISGIPTTPGTYNFTIKVKSGNETASQDLTIIVVQALSTPY